MKIRRKVIERWEELKEHGDMAALQEATGISRVTLTKAFGGEGSVQTVKAIDAFYEARRNELKEQNLA